MIDYNLFYRENLAVDEDWNFRPKLFISVFNLSDRVSFVFDKIDCQRKIWINLSDYDIDKSLLPSGYEIFDCVNKDESEFFLKLVSSLERDVQLDSIDLCIDATGFIKPYLMTFIALLVNKGVKKIDVIFSEPQQYQKKHLTEFSSGGVREVKQVSVFGGTASAEYEGDDILVLGVGYDDNLVRAVINENSQAKKFFKIFGFPSLRADMYQENIIRASRSIEDLDFNSKYVLSSPANDPFSTAQVLHEIYTEHNSDKVNWLLSPLSTKAQMLGFTLFYLNECEGKNVTLLYPYSRSHAKKTSEGVSRVWKYTLEFPYRELSH